MVSTAASDSRRAASLLTRALTVRLIPIATIEAVIGGFILLLRLLLEKLRQSLHIILRRILFSQIFDLVLVGHVTRRVNHVRIVHGLAVRARTLVVRNFNPGRETAKRSYPARVHIHVLVVLATPSLQVENLVNKRGKVAYIIVEVEKRWSALGCDLQFNLGLAPYVLSVKRIDLFARSQVFECLLVEPDVVLLEALLVV